MTTTITPLDQQAVCPSEYGPVHAFILVSNTHGSDGVYGCQRCPEVRLGADIDGPPVVEYRVVERGVVRFINGTPKAMINRRPVTGATATALAAALNDAVRCGADHGVCDSKRELSDLRRGVTTPGHATYSSKGAVITRTVHGQTTVAFDGAKVRPAFMIGDFQVELEYAFLLGGRAPIARG